MRAQRVSEEECERFKQQFTQDEWQRLLESPRFERAWANRAIVEAGEIASELIGGNVNSLKDARNARQLSQFD